MSKAINELLNSSSKMLKSVSEDLEGDYFRDKYGKLNWYGKASDIEGDYYKGWLTKELAYEIADALGLIINIEDEDIEESLTEDSAANKMYAVFDHFNPEEVEIVNLTPAAKRKLENKDYMEVCEITPIQPGKKSLIGNNDEDADTYVSNVTEEEWIQILKDDYKGMKAALDKYGVAGEVGPLYLYFEEGDEGTESEEAFIKAYNEFIEDSWVNGDSDRQYRWYTYKSEEERSAEIYKLKIENNVLKGFDSKWRTQTELIIPDGVTSIAYNAFIYHSHLIKVVIPNTVVSIDRQAFCNCTALTNIEIPEGVEYIGIHAFSSCSKLTTLSLPRSLTSVGSGAFDWDYKLTDVYYNGTEEEWNKIEGIKEAKIRAKAQIHFNSLKEDLNDEGTISIDTFHRIEKFVTEAKYTDLEDLVEQIKKEFNLSDEEVTIDGEDVLFIEPVRVPEEEWEDYFLEPEDEDEYGYSNSTMDVALPIYINVE